MNTYLLFIYYKYLQFQCMHFLILRIDFFTLPCFFNYVHYSPKKEIS